jgi:hypothetical protein
MTLFKRTPQNCARLFNALIALFLIRLGALLALHLFQGFDWIYITVAILYLCAFGLVAYQIEYHPVVAVLWVIPLFVPVVNIILLLILLFQAKTYLRKHNYDIVLLGARLVPSADTIADTDAMIKEGKIKVPDQDSSHWENAK